MAARPAQLNATFQAGRNYRGLPYRACIIAVGVVVGAFDGLDRAVDCGVLRVSGDRSAFRVDY